MNKNTIRLEDVSKHPINTKFLRNSAKNNIKANFSHKI